MKFNEKLQKLRKESQMSQEQLADMLEVSRQAVSKWESGTTYPEMDKLLTMCKIFKCSLDDLTNDEISDITVTETKKKSLSNWFDDFLNGINKTIKMLSRMRFKEFMKMCFYMFVVFCVLLVFFIPINLLIDLGGNIFEVFGGNVEAFLSQLWIFILSILYFTFSATVFIYIFKKKYLDPYNTAIDESEEKIIVNNNDSNDQAQEVKIKTVYKEVETESFGWIGKLCTYMFKFIVAMTLIPFLITFMGLFMGFVIMLILLFKGVTYIGIILAIIFSILINYVIVEILLKVLFSVSIKFKKLFVIFIVAMAGLGIATGLTIFEIAETKYYDEVPENIELKAINKTIDFKDTMYVNNFNHHYYYWIINDIIYVEDESYTDTIKIETSYYEVFNTPTINLTFDDGISIWSGDTLGNWNIVLNSIIENFKKKEFYNYNKLDETTVTIYASKKNIEIMKNNYFTAKESFEAYNCNYENEAIDGLYNENSKLEDKLYSVEQEYFLLESKYNELSEEFKEYKESINDFIKNN